MPNDARMQILYFKESADVLLEFGLQGSYSVRLLTAQVDNYKTFLQQLSKAVGRNSIILTVGGFDAQNRLPEILGRSIGRELEAPPAEEFRITQPMYTQLPKDSIPLVSADGTLAGCVVEKGRQSIIMLTQEATLRQQVFKELVIPYIGERLRYTGGTTTQPAAPETPAAEPASAPPAAPIIPQEESTPAPVAKRAPQDIFSFTEDREFPDWEETPTPKPMGRGGRIAATVVCIVLALLLALGACGLVYYVLQQKQQESIGEKVFLYQTVCPAEAENERQIW